MFGIRTHVFSYQLYVEWVGTKLISVRPINSSAAYSKLKFPPLITFVPLLFNFRFILFFLWIIQYICLCNMDKLCELIVDWWGLKKKKVPSSTTSLDDSELSLKATCGIFTCIFIITKGWCRIFRWPFLQAHHLVKMFIIILPPIRQRTLILDIPHVPTSGRHVNFAPKVSQNKCHAGQT